MAFHYSPKLVTSGLTIALDAANSKSWVGTTKWENLVEEESVEVTDVTYDGSGVGSLLFDGMTSVGSLSSRIFGTDYTITVWFRQDAEITNKGIFGILGSGGNRGYFYVGSSGGSSCIQIASQDSFGSFSYGPNRIIPADRKTLWNEATFVRVGSGVSVYLNGVGVSGTLAGLPDDGLSWIGMYPNYSGSSHFNGSIGFVGVWNRGLSEEEVLQNWRALSPRWS